MEARYNKVDRRRRRRMRGLIELNLLLNVYFMLR